MLKVRKAKTPGGTEVTVLELTGSLDANFADEFRGELEKLDPSRGGSYAVGFEGVGYVCSRVLGSILSFANNLRESGAGGHIVLYAVPEGVRSVMEIVEFHSFFRICADEAEALSVLDGTIPEPKREPKAEGRRKWVLIAIIATVVVLGAAMALVLVQFLDGLF